MVVKVVTHPVTGRAYRLGRRRPIARCPRLSLRNYTYRSLPKPPEWIDYTVEPAKFLGEVLGNDDLGDCTSAGAFHVGGSLLANAGAPVSFAEADAIGFYSRSCGYVPGNESTDNGGDEQTVLNYWQNHGLLPDGSHKITAWLAVDGSDADEVRTALWLFENVYFGVEMPDAWVNPMPSASGFTWDVAGNADEDNGHCFAGFAYNSKGVIIDTWGMLGTVTWSAVAEYAATRLSGELYTVLGSDAVARATAKAPNGFDWPQLNADLNAMR